MEFPELYLYKFRIGGPSDEKFWARHGGMPPLKGCSVLDVGCGWGRLCVDMALAGAARTVGVDIDDDYINFDIEYVKEKYPQLADVVEFKCMSLEDYDDAPAFDYIVSKDSFEHIMDLPRLLSEARKRLKPGGRLYAGFGPLWKSPYGDHRMTRSLTPWGHLWKSEARIIKDLSRLRNKEITSIDQLHLNRLSLSDYRRMFDESGLNIVRFRVNQNKRPISRVFSLLRKIPFLEEYFTHNLYCILEKPRE